MASLELARLWKLHRIDASLLDVRARAAVLDAGVKESKELEVLQKEDVEVGGKARGLQSELTDLELANKGIEDKLKKIDATLYGGKVVNPREVEAYEKDASIHKKHRGVNDERILALWDLLPPAKEASEKLDAKIKVAKEKLAVKVSTAKASKAELEAEYARLNAARPEAAKGISPALLARYDSIRSKHAGTGMSEVVRGRSCGGCGTLLPERTLQGLKEDRMMTCEECHRILYFSEGVI